MSTATIIQRRLIPVAWLLIVLLLLAAACAPPAAPTPTPTDPPPTATPVPTHTPTVPAPTATPTPSPPPTPVPDALVPAGPVTPPPPGFEPSPPPPFDPGIEDPDAWVRDYIELVTAMLNSAENVQAVLDVLIAWAAPSEDARGDLAPFVWAEAADLDGNGAEEWLITLPLPGETFTPMWLPMHLVVFEIEQELFVPRHVIRPYGDEIQVQQPQLLLIDDITADGETEVLIEQQWCGAHTCVIELIVGRWDGATWRNLAAEPISQTYSELTIEDRDGDGALELIMHGGTIGSVGAGLQRPHTLTFAWEDGAYRLVEDVPDPSDHPYYLMLDANTTIAQGEWDRALELAGQAVNDPDFEDSMVPVEEVDKRRIISYAAVELMLVHAHRGDVDAMESVLNQVLGYDFVEPNVYTEAADRLLEVYEETGDVVEACAAMQEIVAARSDEAVFFQWYGYNTTRITVDQVCPLTPPTGDPSPEL